MSLSCLSTQGEDYSLVLPELVIRVCGQEKAVGQGLTCTARQTGTRASATAGIPDRRTPRPPLFFYPVP